MAHFGHFHEAASATWQVLTFMDLGLANEGSDERTTPAVGFPIYVETGTAIRIREGYGWHGVGQLGERGIKGHFVAAEMILVIDRTGLHGGELSGTQQCYSMMLRTYGEFHGRGNYLLSVAEKFASHLMGECDQGCALLQSCLIIDDEDGLCWIGIRVWIAQSGAGMHGGGDGQAVEGDAIPASALDVPCENGLVADEVDFAVGETLSGVDVGTAGLKVVAANLLAETEPRESQERHAQKTTPAIPHTPPHLESILLQA